MIGNFFLTPNVIGRLMIALFFVGGVVFAGAFDGFIVETEVSNCCGGIDTCSGATDAALFSSRACDSQMCNCGCYLMGCTDCEIIASCGGNCDCRSNPPDMNGVRDSCFAHCTGANSNKNNCENDCGK